MIKEQYKYSGLATKIIKCTMTVHSAQAAATQAQALQQEMALFVQ